MRYLAAILAVVIWGAGGPGGDGAVGASSRSSATCTSLSGGAGHARVSTSRAAASQSALAGRVRVLVERLGSPRFSEREAAQKALAELGDGAAVFLVEWVSDPNPEIAQRVAAVLGTPRDPGVRAELGFRLIATADPDWMERGVYLLFEGPCEIREQFKVRVKGAEELSRALCDPVIEMIDRHCRMDAINREKAEALSKTKPKEAARMLKAQEEGRFYDAEAAYFGALDVLAARHEGPEGDLKKGEASTGPSGGKAAE